MSINKIMQEKGLVPTKELVTLKERQPLWNVLTEGFPVWKRLTRVSAAHSSLVTINHEA